MVILKKSDPRLMLDYQKSFALIEKNGRVTAYQGRCHHLDNILDIHTLSLKTGHDIVFVLPYRVIHERGFEAHGNEPILAIEAERSWTLPKGDWLKDLPDQAVTLAGPVVPSMSDDDYAAMVAMLQEQEIEGGNISQTTLSRRFEGQLTPFDLSIMLSIYRRLLGCYGQYMTVLFAQIDHENSQNSHFIAGATPERHLEISGTETIMIPIAGTLRKEDKPNFTEKLTTFLQDPKEINELFQVIDEEMKMMGVIAPEGGSINGPFLREIGAVIHTEYELVGKRSINSIDALRRTLHAPTVMGSPMESAARIIKKYEPDSRRYYAGEIGVYHCPRTAEPDGDLDCAILIRSAEIFGDGRFRIQAGGGLVRDSEPQNEARETMAKAMGMLGILTGASALGEVWLTPELQQKVAPILASRNQYLSRFWMDQQNPYADNAQRLDNVRITIINNEDDFAFMIGHMIRASKAIIRVVDTLEFDGERDDSHLVILGPGPGDPTDMAHPRMKHLQKIVQDLKKRDIPMIGVCLGHQAIAFYEGLSVTRQSQSTQGLQRSVKVFGKQQRLGFYNSFSPVYDDRARARADMKFDLDDENRIIALQGDRFIGFQFHPESVMSQDGSRLFFQALMLLRQWVV
jgi:phenazine biosynthesis protein phzE